MSNTATFITEIGIIIGAIVGLSTIIIFLINGMKCLLRTEMLKIYYHNRNFRKIRQYELENFVHLYKAYKTLKGNSFIDKIYKEVMTWKVLT